MESLEIEVKYHIDDLNHIRQKLLEMGANSHGRYFERNFRFDNLDDRFLKNHALLRLRKDHETTLTFKSKPDINDDRFKIHKELEVQVSDFEIMTQILKHLGYEKKQIYEKYRETFSIDNAIICLDSMPYGDFLEIEASKYEIKRFSKCLKLNWSQRIILNYLEIFQMIKNKLNLDFTDVTFHNFNEIDVRIADLYPLLLRCRTKS